MLRLAMQEAQDAMQELASSGAPAAVLTANPVNGEGKEITVLLEREGRMKSVRKYLVQVFGAGQVSFSAGGVQEEDVGADVGMNPKSVKADTAQI